MSAPSSTAGGTRIFGIKLGVDPKIFVGGLLALTVLLFWYNTRSDDEETRSSGAPRAAAATPGTSINRPRPVSRLRGQNERATLRLRPVEGTRGDVDPTLRLDLLERVRAV